MNKFLKKIDLFGDIRNFWLHTFKWIMKMKMKDKNTKDFCKKKLKIHFLKSQRIITICNNMYI